MSNVIHAIFGGKKRVPGPVRVAGDTVAPAPARPINRGVVQHLGLLALSALVGSVCLAPIVSAEELPPCEPSLKARRVASPLVLTEECPFQGEVVVSFRVKANGRTTNIVVETVRAGQGKAPKYCVSDYARAFVQGFRFPKRDRDCQHVMAFGFSDKK